MNLRAPVFLLLLALPAASLAAEPPVRPKKTRSGIPQLRQPLTDAEISHLLATWDAFDAAMGSIHEAVPPVPADGTDAAAAEAAWAADLRIRSALQRAGTTPEEFLPLYRRVATGWWELIESDARRDTAAGLRREIAALKKANDPDAKEVLDELVRGLASLEKAPKLSADAQAVEKRRSDLARIFSPEAPPAP